MACPTCSCADMYRFPGDLHWCAQCGTVSDAAGTMTPRLVDRCKNLLAAPADEKAWRTPLVAEACGLQRPAQS